MRLFSIFSPRIAALLIKRGFPLIHKEISRKKPNCYVYQFENTLEFQLVFNELMEIEHQKQQ